MKAEQRFEPLAIVRKPEQCERFESLGINCKVLSLEDSTSAISSAMKGFDAVVFTAGAGGVGGAERTVAVDLDGAVKTMEAGESSKTKRFVMVSAFGAGEREFWYNSPLRTYYTCKHYADRVLRTTDLDYTILQPGMLTNDKATGKICFPSRVTELPSAQLNASREDVAIAIVEALNKRATTSRKTLPVINGDIEISKVFAKNE